MQSQVRVRRRGLLINLGPARVPLAVGPQDAQGEHVGQIGGRPPRAGARDPALNDVPMGALDLARADGQLRGQRPVIVQTARRLERYRTQARTGAASSATSSGSTAGRSVSSTSAQRFAVSQVFFSAIQVAGAGAATTPAAAAR